MTADFHCTSVILSTMNLNAIGNKEVQDKNVSLITGYLKQIYPNGKYKIISLQGSKLVIGRNPNADIPVMSPNVSRIHAILKYTENEWIIIDNMSVNGVYVNGMKLQPHKSHLLKNEDLIFLGPPNVTEFKFHYSLLKSFISQSEVQISEPSVPSPCKIRAKENMLSAIDDLKPEKLLISNQLKTESLDNNKSLTVLFPLKEEKPFSSNEPILKNMECRNEMQEINAVLSSGVKIKSSECDCILAQENKGELEKLILKEKLTILEKRLLEKEKIEEELKRKLEEQSKQGQILEKKKELHSRLCNISHPSDVSMVPETICAALFPIEVENFFSPCSQFSKELEHSGENERMNKTENSVKKNPELGHFLLTAAEEPLIEKKAKEELPKMPWKEEIQPEKHNQKELKKEELMAQLEVARCDQQILKEEMISQFGDIMEAELTCAICSELFVKATTLGCSHTFCNVCINTWKKKKKECPICRANIKGETRSIVLDNFIDKMVEKLSAEFKERRNQVIQQHANSSAKVTKEKKKRKNVKKRSNAATRTVSSVNSNEASTSYSGVVAVSRSHFNHDAIINPIIISDDEIDSSFYLGSDFDNYNDTDSSVEGDPWVYYGGYGRCYNCGRSGHWANGCPYR